MEACVYRVKKQFEINSESICRVGDIILVNWNHFDGAEGTNLTRAWGFCPFFQKEECELLTTLNLTQKEYNDYSNLNKTLDPQLYLPKAEYEKMQADKLKAQTLSCLNQAETYLQLAENALRNAKTLNAGSNCDEELLRQLVNREFTVSNERGGILDIKKLLEKQ